nr:MAG TPA_asm: hypothetical protein [Bacteriophage sp.]
MLDYLLYFLQHLLFSKETLPYLSDQCIAVPNQDPLSSIYLSFAAAVKKTNDFQIP